MKLVVMLCGLAFAVPACGGSNNSGARDTTVSSTPTTVTRAEVVPEAAVPIVTPRLQTEGASCAVEGILTCPDGQIDACHKVPDSTDFHKCVPMD